MIKKLCLIGLIAFVTGCAATGENLQANSYSASQVNTAQETTAVQIVSVLPAKIEVDNAEAKMQNQIAGGMLGSITGGVIGRKTHAGTGTGAVVGGVAGAGIATATSPGKVLVEGVTIQFSLKNSMKKILSSTQVGRACEFKAGPAIMITMSKNETRIQPNTDCPAPKS